MKRLMTCLAAAVAVLTASARIVDKQSFEETFGDFNSRGGEDDSSLVAYDNDGPAFAAPYDFSGFGAKYLSIDTGDATLWRTNTVDEGNVYFDMAMKFMPTAAGDEPDAADNKIVVYQNAESNIVVVAGASAADRTATTYTTTTKLDAGTWARLTISAEQKTGETGLFFKVYLGGTLLTDGTVSEFPSLTADTTVNEVGFSGSGALDNFIARTTDPFNHPASYVASVGGSDGEYYATFADALADGHETVTINGNPFRTADGEAYDAENNPYVIASVEDLLALMYGGDKTASYVQTANIDMDGIAPFPGIADFSGVYDGGGFAISNLTLKVAEYTGVFRKVTGTVEDLTVADMGFPAGSAGSFGCAIVGKAEGNAVLRGLTAEGTFCGGAAATHNTAAIAVLVETTAGNGTVKIENCVNNATVYGYHHRIGGILAYTRKGGGVSISNCVNNGTLSWTNNNGSNSGNPGVPRGISGIVACPEGTETVSVKDCANMGDFTVNNATNATLVASAVGDIVGHAYSSGTVVDNGGNTYRAATGLIGGIDANATISRCPYAMASTVDEVEYLTTIKQADLVAGNTYTLVADVAAAETPVFTLNAAGDTISFKTNGFEFAGTVAVNDASTLAATVSTVGDVITYSAVAGVASVDGVAYATFEDAVAAIVADEDPDTDDYVTLLADVSTTLAAGDTLRVKTNGHEFTKSKAADDIVISYADDEIDSSITIYTAVAGVAALNGVWYASFAEAYNHASSTADTMEIRIDGDFVPVLNGTRTFASVTFTTADTTAENISIATTDGNYSFKASNWTFPANATLTVGASHSVSAVSGGTFAIPSGVTVSCSGVTVENATYVVALDNVAALSGSGVLACGATPSAALRGLLQASSWEGTLEFQNVAGGGKLSLYGNANSTIRFVNTGWMFTSGANDNNIKAIEVTSLDLEGVNGGDACTIPCAVAGSGTIAVAATYGGKYRFTGDVSGFTGDVTLSSSTAQIEFGATTLSSGGSIIVGNGSSVTNTGTWTANNLIVLGELVANGTMALASGGKLWGDTGTGVYRANSAAAAVVAAGSWKGTYIIGYDLSAATALNNFGSHADATIVFDGTTSGSFWIGSGSSAYTVVPTLRLDKDLVIRDGLASASDEYLLTFSKIAGTGSLTTKTTGDVTGKTIRYRINTLENYSGTLNVSDKSVVTIDKVNVAELPADGTRVVKTAVGATGSINDNVPLYVANVDSGKTLTYDASGADGAGLYLAGSTPVYPTYVGTDTTLQSQYDAWLTAFNKPDTASVNETAFLLNVDPDTGDKTLDVTVIAISGTTVTITIDHEAVNGYPYVKSAATLEGLSSATPVPATVEDGVITLPSQTGTATFYRVGVSPTPIDNN